MIEVPYRYRARLKRVVDGDTFDLAVDLGHHTGVTARYRLRGVDTPKAHTDEGKAATNFVENWFHDLAQYEQEWPVVIDTHKDERGRWGRWIADVFCATTGDSLAELLLEAELAVDYS